MAAFSGVSSLGWAITGGTIAGTADATGQYLQNGVIRWGQTGFSTLAGAVTTPLGMQFKLPGQVLIGTTSGAANTQFKNAYYGDTNSVIWGALIGAGSTAIGYKAGQVIQAQYPIYQTGVAALLQQPNLTGIVRGNVTGAIVQTPSSFFDADIPNKVLP